MYQASAENWGDSRFVVTTRDASFVTDTRGKGANPVETLLGSLCSCMGHYVHDHFVAKDTPLSAFRVSATCETSADAARILEISVRIDLGRVHLDRTEQTALLAAVAKCKIHGTLRQACEVHVAVTNAEGTEMPPSEA